ncbi:MAG: PorP/SprF family type IX secretion system membrane protein [Bacteroidales bacterium]
MKTIKMIIISFFLLYGFNMFAQDPSFSQFYMNQTYYNPAFVGIHGGMMFNSTYRRQWVNIPSKFETMYVNFDSDISCISGLGGIGFSAYRDSEGLGYLTNTGFKLSLSTRSFINQNTFVQFGSSLSLIQQKVDFSKFTFPDQYDPMNGLSNPTSFTFQTDSRILFPDISFGFVIKGGDGPKKGLFNSNFDYKIGASIDHLVSPKRSFLGQEESIPKKIVLSANANIATNRTANFIFSPCFVFEKQDYMNTFLFGYNFTWGETVYLGNWLRINNITTLSFTFGFNSKLYKYNNRVFDMLKFYYCYDITISGIDNTSTGGSHEIGIAYLFERSLCKFLGIGNSGNKHKRMRRIPCIEFKPASY